jgi:hypothetical protein
MSSPARAPRFHAFWERLERRSILTMPVSDWETLGILEDSYVKIDVAQTPMSRVANHTSVVATVAKRFSLESAEISIYRYDETDEPTPYNVDKYLVLEWLPMSEQFHLEKVRARDLWHLTSRTARKVLSHTVGVYLNRKLGREPLQFEGLIAD